jgi:hypothetical protein
VLSKTAAFIDKLWMPIGVIKPIVAALIAVSLSAIIMIALVFAFDAYHRAFGDTISVLSSTTTKPPSDDDLYFAITRVHCGRFEGMLWGNEDRQYVRMYGTKRKDVKRFKVVDGELYFDGKKCKME